MMSNITLLRTMLAKKRIRPITAMAPAKAAASTAMKPDSDTLPAVMLPPSSSMTNATPRLAPLLMPKTLGPARGLRKAV